MKMSGPSPAGAALGDLLAQVVEVELTQSSAQPPRVLLEYLWREPLPELGARFFIGPDHEFDRFHRLGSSRSRRSLSRGRKLRWWWLLPLWSSCSRHPVSSLLQAAATRVRASTRPTRTVNRLLIREFLLVDRFRVAGSRPFGECMSPLPVVLQSAAILQQTCRHLARIDGDAVRLQPMRPKLAEVAQRAEVSEATVSRVLNGRPGVAEATRRRVLGVMGDLGYRDVPSLVGRSEVVGIITPELENPVFALFAQSLQSHLANRGMLPVVCSATSETVNEQDYLDHFVSTRAAGAIVVNGRYAQPEVGYDSYVAMRDGGLPLVLVNGIHDTSPLPAIAIDLRTATAAAVRHLVTLGHRRIGMVVGPIRVLDLHRDDRGVPPSGRSARRRL